ncbi:MAG: hypothetical protein ACKVVP_12695 [Chloroflexota bacterium]
MSLWDRLRGLFTASSDDRDDDDDGEAFYLYIACDRCNDLVSVRVNRRNDLSQEFNPSTGAVSSYRYQKGIVDQRCFRPIHVSITFDSSQREEMRDIAGGHFITREEFRAGQTAEAKVEE